MQLIFSELVKSETDLSLLAEKLRRAIKINSIILLSGDIAAGKTTFVSAFCKLFGIKMVQSPTYALHQRYTNQSTVIDHSDLTVIDHSDLTVIDHFDLYRLKSEEEVQSAGFHDQLNSPANYKFVEWPESVQLQDFPLGVPLYILVFIIIDSGTNSGFRQLELSEIC